MMIRNEKLPVLVTISSAEVVTDGSSFTGAQET